MVPSDDRGRMIPSKLEELILERKAKGHIPFFVNATAGTTVIGAFDPIPEIADICQRHKLWLHIDVSITSQLSKIIKLYIIKDTRNIVLTLERERRL